jgi:hypothetical protein
MRREARRARSPRAAQALYEVVRPQLYPNYRAWDNAVDRVIDYQLEAVG